MRSLAWMGLCGVLGLLVACGSPTKDVASAQDSVADSLGGSLKYFGSNQKELESFLAEGDGALADKMLLTSLNSVSDTGDRRFINGVQRVAAYLAQSGAPPERFGQLCERLRFAFIFYETSDYHYARVYENLCIQGQGVNPGAVPGAVSALSNQGNR